MQFVDKVRKDFPILESKVYDKQLIYLDNAASAQKPKLVIDKVSYLYSCRYANIHRGLYYFSNEVTAAYEDARVKVAKFLGAQHKEEIVFTRSATEAINLVSYSFGLDHLTSGDSIVLSVMEHHSNIVPWYFHQERKGVKLKWIDIDLHGELLIEEFKKSLTKDVKLVAITHMSNVLGTQTSVKELVKLAHARNIPVLIDGSQAVAHGRVDVKDIDCDFYVFTGHKLYGPSGIGVLYAKQSWLNKLPPFNGGGEMITAVTRDKITYADPPYKFEAGTQPIVQAIGLGTAIDYLDSIGYDNIYNHEQELAVYAREALSEVKGFKLLADVKPSPIISFSLADIHPHDVATILDRYAIAIRAGSHCAQILLSKYNKSAVCRVSLAMYNTREEVDILVKALIKVKSLFG